MTTALRISTMVALHLRLYHKERYSFWVLFPAVVLIGFARFFDTRGVMSQHSIVLVVVTMIFLAHDRFIIDPCSNADNELTKLSMFPLNAREIILAKYAASALIVVGSCFSVILVATALLNLPFARAADAMLFVVSTIIPMFVLGAVLAAPMHVTIATPILFSTFSSIALGVSSIPYVLAKVVLGSDVLCLAWIVASSAGAAYLAATVTGQWITDRKFRRDAS